MIGNLYSWLGRPKLCNPFKKRVTLVFESVWLPAGRYGFTFVVGDPQAKNKLMDFIVDMMPGEPDIRTIGQVRADPMIRIVEIF